MKDIFKTLFSASLLLIFTTSSAQSKKMVCQPLNITFKSFQKQSMNFSVGLGTSRYNVDKKNYRSFNGQLGINYFPLNYFELGFKAKPTIANNITIGRNNLFESNLYIRYYPLFIACRKIALFTGASILHDGSEYSPKGNFVSRNELFPSLTAGLVFVPKPAFQIEAYSDIFLKRTMRYNVGVTLNIKTIFLK